jgi:hypothetical protein
LKLHGEADIKLGRYIGGSTDLLKGLKKLGSLIGI